MKAFTHYVFFIALNKLCICEQTNEKIHALLFLYKLRICEQTNENIHALRFLYKLRICGQTNENTHTLRFLYSTQCMACWYADYARLWNHSLYIKYWWTVQWNWSASIFQHSTLLMKLKRVNISTQRSTFFSVSDPIKKDVWALRESSFYLWGLMEYYFGSEYLQK